MKKSLYMMTALTVAGILAFGITDAFAAEKTKKMSVGVSGFFISKAGFSNQNTNFESTSNGVSRVHYDSFNIRNDSEIAIKGSAKLDNGVTVSVVIQFETDQVASSQTIDESYMKLTGGFGDLRLGSTKHASFVLHTSAPMVGTIGLDGGDSNNWVIQPGGLSSLGMRTDIGLSDNMKFVYISPVFGSSGFRFGTSYEPSNNNSNLPGSIGGNAGTDRQTFDFVIQYKGKFGGTSLTTDVAYWETHGPAANSLKGIRFGGKLGFGAVSIGGTYKRVKDLDSVSSGTGDPTNETRVYAISAQYAAGGMKVALGYAGEKKEMTVATPGDAEGARLALGGSINLGTGVDFLASIVHVDWDDEGTAYADNNKGWAVVGGIKVSF